MAVVLVVGGDLVEVRPVAVVLERLPALERPDRPPQVGLPREAEDRFERLQAVPLGSRADRLARDAVEVDEDLAAQELVDLVLPGWRGGPRAS